MKYLIISFKTRNNLIAFNKILSSRGVVTSIINTPRSVALSCGLSIKTNYSNLNLIYNLINQTKPAGLIGVFIFNQLNKHNQIERIY